MIRSGKFRNMLSRATCWPGSGTKICPFGVYDYGNRAPRVSRDFRLNSKIKCNLKESLGSLMNEMKKENFQNSDSLAFMHPLSYNSMHTFIYSFLAYHAFGSFKIMTRLYSFGFSHDIQFYFTAKWKCHKGSKWNESYFLLRKCKKKQNKLS